MKKIAIATPTYNEAKNIRKLITLVAKECKDIPDTDITFFVIDDNSPDGTADVAEGLAKKYKAKNFKVEVLRRNSKDGIGKAYVAGFKILLAKKYDWVLQMDADLSHDPKYIKDFVAKAADNDFVVGSRYIAGGGTPDWGLHRRVLSKGGNYYSRLFLGSTITDYTGGFNMYKASLLREIDVDTLSSSGYGFLIELKYKALSHAKKTAQVPIIFLDRQHGSSKIPKSTIFANFILVPKIRFRKTHHKV